MGSDSLTLPISIALVRNLDVIAEGMRAWVAADGRVVVAAVADSVADVLAGPGRDADVLVLDLEFGRDVAIDQVSELADAGYRVVVFSSSSRPLLAQAVLAAGACAYLDKRMERGYFIDTIVAVAHDRPPVTQPMAGSYLPPVRLSDRERQALRHLFRGMDYASIARRLTKPTGEPISALTVKQYIERARAKYAAAGRPCRSNFALLARCIEDGLVSPEEIDDYRPTS